MCVGFFKKKKLMKASTHQISLSFLDVVKEVILCFYVFSLSFSVHVEHLQSSKVHA